ncbi:MAG TPA: glutamyl-tRNA reductase [Anaerolineaceae bacterium]|nr:glutamyl-tRNA reductase [Anaerolineaceae bacterium]
MKFYCLGISHQTAALEVREPINAAVSDLSAALRFYRENVERFLGAHSELAVLTTCNRFEVYAADPREDNQPARSDQAVFQVLLAYIEELTGSSMSERMPQFYRYHDLAVVEHLFRVASGLESQVLGEPQILGQVADALETAVRVKTARHTLSTLFRAALSTGKRAQTETKIGYKPASLSSVAVNVAEQQVGKLRARAILVVGSGEMSQLAVKAFRLRAAQNVTVVSRTYAHAVFLAAQSESKARPFDELPAALRDADIVVSATAAQQPILGVELVRQVMQHREDRPLILVDLAVPRDVDPGVRAIPGVRLFDLDDLKKRLDDTVHHRQVEAAQVGAIVAGEVQAFARWMEVIPTIGKLHRKAERIRQREVQRIRQHLPDLDPDVEAQIEHLSSSLIKKLLHEPTVKLRKQVDQDQLEEHVASLNFLFGLYGEDGLESSEDDGNDH